MFVQLGAGQSLEVAERRNDNAMFTINVDAGRPCWYYQDQNAPQLQ